MQSYASGWLHVMTRISSFAGRQTWGQLDHGAWLGAKAWPGATARGNLAMLEFDEQAKLPQVEIPVLVVGGNYDRITTPEASQRIAQLAPHSRETAIPSGHLGIWERHSDLGDLLVEFASHCLESSRTNQAAPQPSDLAEQPSGRANSEQ